MIKPRYLSDRHHRVLLISLATENIQSAEEALHDEVPRFLA